jgi:hypothetical protein
MYPVVASSLQIEIFLQKSLFPKVFLEKQITERKLSGMQTTCLQYCSDNLVPGGWNKMPV